MPIYQYQCEQGHVTERIRRIDHRNEPVACESCQQPSALIIARSHVGPDGIYSYAPNIGDPERFERQREAIRSGQKVIPRTPSKGDLERWNDPVKRKLYPTS